MRRALSSTMRAARLQAARREGPAQLEAARLKADDGKLIRHLAKVMADTRAELIAEPLSKCWHRIALAVVEAIDTYEGN